MNQVLIDGMKVNAAAAASTSANLTTVGIGRAEIVRGPQSSLYGADAMTSVMQFFTPKGEGPLSIWGSVKGGNYSTDEERIGASWGGELGGAFFEFGRAHTGGILDVNNAYTNYTTALRLDFQPIPDLTFTLTGRYIASTLEFPTEGFGDLLEPFLDPNQSTWNRALRRHAGRAVQAAAVARASLQGRRQRREGPASRSRRHPAGLSRRRHAERHDGEPHPHRLQRGADGAQVHADRVDGRARRDVRGGEVPPGQLADLRRRTRSPRAGTRGPATASSRRAGATASSSPAAAGTTAARRTGRCSRRA